MFDIKKRNKLLAWVTVALFMLVCGGALAQITTEDLMPQGRIIYPGLSTQGAKYVPPTFTIGAEGTDPDSPNGLPSQFRLLMKSAVTPGGTVIRTPYEYNLYYQEVLSLDDPDWSEWVDMPVAPETIGVRFPDMPVNEYFLISVQFMDLDGAVSNPFGYQIGTIHVKTLADFFRPYVTLNEVFLGQTNSSEMDSEIASGQPLNFSWMASAAAYNGQIVSYRHGWDLVSVDDPNDPGWAVPPGTAPQNLFAAERSFQDGSHVFTVRVEDDSQQVRIMNWTLRVIPFVSREHQLPLLVLDQTVDRLVQNWPDQSGRPRNDESFRNPWWHFLADGAGGVAGINWERDWKDHTDQVSYSDVVKYKAVLCYAENNSNQRMFMQFRAINDVDRYVWLTPYQQRGGNLFLVGGTSMESFLEVKPNYMVPMVFDTTEEELIVNDQVYEVGFGTKTLPDGTKVLRGPEMYPYATAGIAALDWTSPNTKTIYNRPVIARFDRAVDCAGLKGLVLALDFKYNHLIGPGVIADTLWTDPVIDWHDVVDAAADTLALFHLTFPFRADEFVNANISSRATPIIPQDCDEGPGGQCIEPMFTGIARYDFVREYHWAQGETDWPDSRYTAYELDSGCGPLALTSYEGNPRGSALTNGQTFGYFSYKTVADKPTYKADVYWGFDPYRFEHTEARKAIRWVLQYFGLTINQ